MNKTLFFAGISGMIAVGMGAFGAHSIKPQISPESYEVFQTAVLYHFIHTIVLLIIGNTSGKDGIVQKKWAIRLMFTGTILFSGSLYLLSTRAITGWDNVSIAGPVTPLGGLFFILGWGLLALSALKRTTG